MFSTKSAKTAPVQSRIRVPQLYYRQPVISRLVSRYGLSVNITAASLISGNDNDGWFDVELQGNPQQLAKSLSYLQGLGVDLVQLGIAGNLHKSENSQPFPTRDRSINQSESGSLTSQWQTQFQHQIFSGQANRLRLQLCIFKSYYQKPIISELVSCYGLTVNITSALLNPDVEDDGWFDLELWGRPQQLSSSLSYLEKLGLPLWVESACCGNNNLIE
ncbi:MAG: NIL domain-containing protein [Heteroscytonema crispum UTEX LB 1556]